MGTLKYAILGLLDQKEQSGYDIAASFSSSISDFWNANHSQIYPELRRLTEAGLVTYRVEISGQVLERKVYSLTEEGRRDFLSWLDEEAPIAPSPKDVFRLRMFFSARLSPERRQALIRHELEQHRDRLERLKEKLESYALLPAEDPRFGDYLVLRGAVMREETHCCWLEECLAETM